MPSRWTANPRTNSCWQAYRAGDMRAFERLVARYEKPIWNFIRRFVPDAATAEDLLQEVFLRVVEEARTNGGRRRQVFDLAVHDRAQPDRRSARAEGGSP